MKIKSIHIILTGYNQRAVIAFLRTLVKLHEPFALIASSGSDTIFKTEYRENVICARKKLQLDLDDILQSILIVKERFEAQKYIIAPSTESLNRFMLEHRKKIELLDCVIPLVSKELYETISNKYSFSKICESFSIKVPFEYDQLERTIYPYVAKPKRYSTINNEQLSPFLIFNEEDRQIFKKNNNVNDFYYQQYIDGRSFYLLYYFHRNGTMYKYSQENIVQQPYGKSIVAALSSNIHESEESEKYENMLRELNFFGFIMIELKQHHNNYYMIEANPRFWGPSQLFVDASRNFFESYLFDYGNLLIEPFFVNNKKMYRYFWFSGFLQSYKKKIFNTFYKEDASVFFSMFEKWLEVDVYKREDTLEIFKYETIKIHE